MKRPRFTKEQIAFAMRLGDSGTPVADFAAIERYLGGGIAVPRASNAINKQELEIAITHYEPAPD